METQWISVEDSLPELEQPIWMYFDGKIKMGCRSNYANEGWLWCALDYMPYWIKSTQEWDIEPISDDDYKVSYWMPLPKPPKLNVLTEKIPTRTNL